MVSAASSKMRDEPLLNSKRCHRAKKRYSNTDVSNSKVSTMHTCMGSVDIFVREVFIQARLLYKPALPDNT